MEKLTKASLSILALLVVITPVILQLVWQLMNVGLPFSDAGDHFRISFLIFLAFKEGIWHGIEFIFSTGGKPVLFSVFASPLIYLFDTNALLPVRTFTVLIQLITTMAYYKLFRFRAGFISSALMAAAITTSPYIFNLHTQFMPEIVWHMWFVLFLMALIYSNHLCNQYYAVLGGIFLSLTILARPVESVILIIPPFIIYLIYQVKELQASTRVLFIHCSLSFFCIFACAMVNILGWPSYIGIVLIISLGLIYWLTSTCRQIINSSQWVTSWYLDAKYLSQFKRFSFFFYPFFSLISLWVLFNFKAIEVWALSNSFGSAAKINDQLYLSKNIFSIFYDLLSLYGLTLSLGLAVFFVLTLSLAKRTLNQRKSILYIAVALLFALLPMLMAYSITGTSDSRRMLLGIVYFFIVMALYIFQSARNYLNIFKLLIFIVFIVQAFAIGAVISGSERCLIVRQKDEGPYIGASIGTCAPNKQKSFDAEVIKKIQALGVSDAKIAVFSLGMFSDRELYQAESLRFVTLGIDRTLNFGTMWGYTDYEPVGTVIERLKINKFQYLLLDDLDNPIKTIENRKRLVSHTFFVSDLLGLIHKKSIIKGLTLVGVFDIEGRRQYLFTVDGGVDSGAHTYASSQFENFSAEGLLDAIQPGWHSKKNPLYPQTITLNYNGYKAVKKISLLPQDGNNDRMPKHIRIKYSDDGAIWKNVAEYEDVCLANQMSTWKELNLVQPIKAKYLQLEILSNCGSPDLLTLRGLKVD